MIHFVKENEPFWHRESLRIDALYCTRYWGGICKYFLFFMTQMFSGVLTDIPIKPLIASTQTKMIPLLITQNCIRKKKIFSPWSKRGGHCSCSIVKKKWYYSQDLGVKHHDYATADEGQTDCSRKSCLPMIQKRAKPNHDNMQTRKNSTQAMGRPTFK